MDTHEATWRAYERGEARPRPRLVNGDVEEKPPLTLHPARLPDPSTIPPRQWLYGTQLVRGYVTVLVAPGGTGKSAYAMALALGLTANKSVLGDHIFCQVNSAIFNLEDPMDELERRLAALMIRHKIKRDDIAGRLFLDTGEERSLTMAALGDDGFSIVFPDEEQLIKEIQRNKIGVLICDPYAESHNLEENSNPQMVKAAAAWRRVARATGCAVLLVHHVRKGDAGGIDAARGAKALTDSARVGLLMSTMNVAEGQAFGIEADDCWQYVRLDDAKRNMAPAAKAKWFRLDQVSLDNGTVAYPNGDHVAALISWEPPSAWDGIPMSRVVRILELIDQGPVDGEYYAFSPQSKDRWAGAVIMDDADKTKEQAKLMLKQWKASGVLEEGQYLSPKSRHLTACVRVNLAKVSGMGQFQEPI